MVGGSKHEKPIFNRTDYLHIGKSPSSTNNSDSPVFFIRSIKTWRNLAEIQPDLVEIHPDLFKICWDLFEIQPYLAKFGSFWLKPNSDQGLTSTWGSLTTRIDSFYRSELGPGIGDPKCRNGNGGSMGQVSYSPPHPTFASGWVFFPPPRSSGYPRATLKLYRYIYIYNLLKFYFECIKLKHIRTLKKKKKLVLTFQNLLKA